MNLAFAESIQLIPDGTLVIHIAIIITMIFILNIILYRPINRVLNERENRTRGRLVEAREILERVEANLSRYENGLRQARAEGYQILEKQQITAYSERQQQISSVRGEIEKQINDQKNAIDEQAEEARKLLKDEAIQVAESIRFQILGR